MAMFLDMLYYPLLEQLLWWRLGLSAVLVHRDVVTREYVEEEKGEVDGLDCQLPTGEGVYEEGAGG